jgi:hypothetical protein
MITLGRKFFALDRSNRRLVLEAASLMAFVWVGLRLIRFLALRRILDRYVSAPTASHATLAPSAAIDAVRWAIGAVAARVPAATCLVQALAGDAMLRRRHLAPEVCLGVRVRRNGAAPIEGHAWVECDGAVAVGCIDNLSDFEVLTARSR